MAHTAEPTMEEILASIRRIISEDNDPDTKFSVFISYAHGQDTTVALRLKARLERYVLPMHFRRTLSRQSYPRRPFHSIFLDRDELVPGARMSARIEKALGESSHLIVVSTPDSRNSAWVSREVSQFIALGRERNIVVLLARGEPEEAILPSLRYVSDQEEQLDTSSEPLWVDWREGRKSRRRFLKLVASLLSLTSFDDLVRRDLLRRRQQASFFASAATFLALVFTLVPLHFSQEASAQKSETLAAAAQTAANTRDYARAARYAVIAYVSHPSASSEAALRRLAIEANKVRQPIVIGGPSMVESLKYSPNGKILAAVGLDGGLLLWDVVSNREIGRTSQSQEKSTATNASFDATQPPQSNLIAFSLDGLRTFVASSNGVEYHATLAKDEPDWLVSGGSVSAISVSSRGVLATGNSRDIHLWNIDKRVALGDAWEVGGPWPTSGTVNALAFSSNGELLLSVSEIEGRTGDVSVIQVWNVATRREIGPLIKIIGHASASISSDGNRLAIGEPDGKLRIWDVASGRAMSGPLIGPTTDIQDVAFSQDGHLLGASELNGHAFLWDVTDLARSSALPIGMLSRPHVRGGPLAFSPDGEELSTGWGDGRIIVWKTVKTWPLSAVGMPAADSVESDELTFSPDSRRIFAIDDRSITDTKGRPALGIWTVSTGARIWSPLIGNTRWIRSIAWSPDGRLIASSSDEGEIRLWDAGSLREVGAPITHSGKPADVISFSPDSGHLIVKFRDGVWDLNIAQRKMTVLLQLDLRNIGDNSDVKLGYAYSPDGKSFATNTKAGLQLWSLVKEKSWYVVKGKPRTILGPETDHNLDNVGFAAQLTYSPDGRFLAFAPLGNRPLQLWNVGLSKWEGHNFDSVSKTSTEPPTLSALAFSRDGRIMATSVSEAWKGYSALKGVAIHLWDVQSGRELGASLIQPSHSEEEADEVDSLSLSPDGTRLASASFYGGIRIWKIDPAVHLQGAELVAYVCSVIIPGELALLDATDAHDVSALDPKRDHDACHISRW